MRARNFNIDSLAVSHTDQPDISRMTITLHGDDVAVEQAAKQLYRLIDVLKVQDVTREPTVEHELALVKIRATDSNRAEILKLVELSQGPGRRPGRPSRSSSRSPAPRPRSTRSSRSSGRYGIKELVRTGAVVMSPRVGSIEEAIEAMTATHVLRQRRRPVGARRADRRDHRLRQRRATPMR